LAYKKNKKTESRAGHCQQTFHTRIPAYGDGKKESFINGLEARTENFCETIATAQGRVKTLERRVNRNE
jgi:hypothetical protein